MANYNPSDTTGPLQSQHVVMGVIVDNKDPDQDGRFKVRILGEQDDQAKMPDDQLQWLQCMTNNQPQSRMTGKFPAGNYVVGSKVILQNLGAQGYVIMGAVTNNEKDDATRDSHPNSTSTSALPWADAMSPQNHPWSRLIEGKFPHEVTPMSQTALSILNGELPTNPPEKEDGVQKVVNEVPTTSYGGRRKAKKGDWDNKVGLNLFNGDKNATQFLSQVGAKELVPNAINMIENLKKTAESGSNPEMPDSLGGLGNILGALAGILSMLNQAKQGSKKEDDQILEQFLRKEYKRQTGKEPLDQFGNETKEYQKWRAEYKAAHNMV